MAMVSDHIAAPVESVWAELADGWSYSAWVVGTIKIRAVDPGWPREGSKLFHAIGAWPLMLQDETEVTTCVEHERLVLQARGWPIGEATVDVRIAGEGAGTRVELREEPVSGPGAWLNNPLVDKVGEWRLTEMMARFTALVEGRRLPQHVTRNA
jgi:polyketide cyclase/dehydrase/lipid transport protein